MKLHKIKAILAVAAMGILSQSCLDLEPKDQLAESNLWSSPSEFQLFANQFYGWTRDFGSLTRPSRYTRIIIPTFSQVATTVIVSATVLTRCKSPMAITAPVMRISGVLTYCYRMRRNIPLPLILRSM